MNHEANRTVGEGQHIAVETLGLSAGDRKALGPVRSVHETASRTHLINIAIAGTFTLLLGGAATVVGVMSLSSAPGSGLGWAALFFAGLAVGPAVGVFLLARKLSWRLALFENGFVYVRGREKIVFWDEVESVVVGGLNIDRHLVLHFDDGSKLQVDNSFRDFGAFASVVRDHVTRGVLARANAALEKGEAVRFGKIHVTREGLDQEGKARLPWKGISRALIEGRMDGNLIYSAMVIYANGKPDEVEWAARRIGNFPNIDAFVALLERLARIKIENLG